MTTATAFLGVPTAPAQQVAPTPQVQQIPTGPVELQSTELDEARWKHMRATMLGCVAKLAALLDVENGLSATDELRYDDGTADLDFEESSIELLVKVEAESAELNRVAARMRWNLQIRNHDPIQAEGQPEGVQQG